MLNCLDTQRTHSVFASAWFRECGEKLRSQQHSLISQMSHHSARPAPFVVALLAIFLDDYFGFLVATPLVPGVRIRTVMKCGCVFAQASAFCLVSKKRSMTTALRSSAFRPDERAALRLITSGPLSTATHVASPKTTLLP